VAIVLDSPLSPTKKISLAPELVGPVSNDDPRGELQRQFAELRGDYTGDDRAAYDDIAARADDIVVVGVRRAFRPAFLIAGGLGLLAGLLVAPAPSRRLAVAAAGAGALLLPVGYAVTAPGVGPEPVTIADPCRPRDLPDSGGITGIAQQAALVALDRAACRFDSSREELVLALADRAEARRFERRHGVDPRSPTSLLGGILGLP
jgi:hypothetical protein